MENIKRVLSFIRRAVDDYKMISAGDKIAVGVSGGKDSLTLLCALAQLRRFYPEPFEVVAITVNMGLEGMDFSAVEELCRRLEVPYHSVPTEIYKIISRCARSRILVRFAQRCAAARCIRRQRSWGATR